MFTCVKVCGIFADLYGADPDNLYFLILEGPFSPFSWVDIDGRIVKIPKFALHKYQVSFVFV